MERWLTGRTINQVAEGVSLPEPATKCNYWQFADEWIGRAAAFLHFYLYCLYCVSSTWNTCSLHCTSITGTIHLTMRVDYAKQYIR